MVKVERKTIETPPPVEIVMTMDILTDRAVKAAIQVASQRIANQKLSPDAVNRVEEAAAKLYNANVVIQPQDLQKPF